MDEALWIPTAAAVLDERLISIPVERDSLRVIESIYERCASRFLRVARAIVDDPAVAEDVVQDAFAQAVLRRGSFRGSGAAEGWIWRIVVNTARSRRRRDRIEATALERLGTASEAAAADDPSGDSLRREIKRLPERQRLVVFLRYYADLDYDSIARVLAISPGTVGKLLNDARSRLEVALEGRSG